MSSEKINDSIWVKNYQNGDEKALVNLLEKHKDSVYRFIYSKLYDKALSEDIFQDTFIKVIQNLKLGKYNEKGKFLPWVMRIAHNLVIDHFRRNSRFKKVNIKLSIDDSFDIFTILETDEDNIESLMIREQTLQILNSLLRYLPPAQQEIIHLRFYMGLTFKEISEDTGVSINTALGRMRYALINLRKVIKKKELSLL